MTTAMVSQECCERETFCDQESDEYEQETVSNKNPGRCEQRKICSQNLEGCEQEMVHGQNLVKSITNRRLPKDSSVFTWMKKTPVKEERFNQASMSGRKKTPVQGILLERKNILSAPKKKNSTPKVVRKSQSELDRSQPRINNVYRRVPLKRPSFDFDECKTDYKQ